MTDASLSLEKEGGRLVLRDLSQPKLSPLSVDFLAPSLLYRLRCGLGKTEPFAKALGVRAGTGFAVDATAGLGVDSLIMAAYGFRVLGVERSPIVFALLQDGLERLRASGELPEIAARLDFVHGEGAAVLLHGEAPDVVYLDPMYPEEGRSKSALPKKAMQIFRRLIGEDPDTAALLASAVACARERVIVKRPVHAPSLGGAPRHSFAGKTARYDVYHAAQGG